VLVGYRGFPESLAEFNCNPLEFESLYDHPGALTALASRDAPGGSEYFFHVDVPRGPAVYWSYASEGYEATAASIFEYSRAVVSCIAPPEVREVPPFSCSDLAEFQIAGVNWMINLWKRDTPNCVLGDDAGMGKTVQFIRFFAHLREHGNWRGPVLILARGTQEMGFWSREFQRNGRFAVLKYDGTIELCAVLRVFAISDSHPSSSVLFEIMLTTYDIFSRDFDFLNQIPFQIMCCDNPDCFTGVQNEIQNKLSQIKLPFTVILMDTLLDEKISGVKELVRFVRPRIDPNWLVRLESLEDLMHCRRASDFGEGYAINQSYVAFVTMTPIQLLLWRLSLLRQLDRYLLSHPGRSVSNNEIGRMIYSHPLLIPGLAESLAVDIQSNENLRLVGISAKFICLDRCISVLIEEHRTVIIMTQFLPLLPLLEALCKFKVAAFAVLSDQLSDEDRIETIRCMSEEGGPKILLSVVPLRHGEIPHGAAVFLLDANLIIPSTVFDSAPIFRQNDQHERVVVISLLTSGTPEHVDYVAMHREQFFLRKRFMPFQMDSTESRFPPITELPGSQLMSVLADSAELLHVNSFEEMAKSSLFELPAVVNDPSALAPLCRAFFSAAQPPPPVYDATLDAIICRRLIRLLKLFGFGGWSGISKQIEIYQPNRCLNYACVFVLLAFRSLPHVIFSLCPLLVYRLRKRLRPLTIEQLLCSDPMKITDIADVCSSFSVELRETTPLLPVIAEEAETLVLTLEIRLTYSLWAKRFGAQFFLFAHLAPPRNQEVDRHAFAAFREFRALDLGDDGQRLPGHRVHDARFPCVAPPEKADMHASGGRRLVHAHATAPFL
jgi:hypothetical protein